MSGWVIGPFNDIWPASDIEVVDGRWQEKVAEPRILLTASPFLPEDERKAVLNMAVAAPDMLEALLGVLRVADRATPEFDAARAAIAKAKGLL